jgi:hypothetical protein
MPGSGSAGTTITGKAPPTPACHDSCIVVARPSRYSRPISPSCQTLPSLSWANQSSVLSRTRSPSVTTSRTTLASMPSTVLVRRRTVTSTRRASPSASVSR